MVCEQFANQMRVCVDENANLRCAIHKRFAYCSLQTIPIPFSTNRNLSVFCVNTKRTGCVGCPFHAPRVLCSPQVRRKLINRTPDTHRMQTAQCASGALVYTTFKDIFTTSSMIHYLNDSKFGWHFRHIFYSKMSHNSYSKGFKAGLPDVQYSFFKDFRSCFHSWHAEMNHSRP